MLDRDHTGNESTTLRRTSLRLKNNFFVGDELLGRGRHRFVTEDFDFTDFEDILIWIMSVDCTAMMNSAVMATINSTRHRMASPLHMLVWADETPTITIISYQSIHRLAQTLVAW